MTTKAEICRSGTSLQLLARDRAAELGRRLGAGESKAALARDFGLDRTTVYRYIGRQQANTPSPEGAREASRLIQTDTHCPCGDPKVLALGLCSTCYTLKGKD